MIKNLGGVFGRNPAFNNVEVEGDLSVEGTVALAGTIDVTGDAVIHGTLGVTGQITGMSSVKLEDAALNTTVFSQDHTINRLLEISSYYTGTSLQLPWLRNDNGNIITIGDIDNQAGQSGPVTVMDCENGTFTTTIGASQIYMEALSISVGTLVIDTNTGNISAPLNNISASSLTANNAVSGKTIVTGAQSITQGTATATTATLVQTVIAGVVSASTFSSVKYFIQARNTTTSRFQITEIVSTRNATTTVASATPVDTNTGGVAATYAVDISGGNFRLLATPQAASSTVFKILYTAIP